VLGHGGGCQPEQFRDLAGAQLARTEREQDSDAGGICQCLGNVYEISHA
jgi:hypothetical protein